MKIISLIFSAFFLIFSTLNAVATPDEIIIIRHADKLIQADPGPVLSPRGELRAIAFAYYYLNQYPEPDYIFAVDPQNRSGKASSVRELETVAPLANLLAERHPKIGYPILHPYPHKEYRLLAKELLHNPVYDHKRILICWDHQLINSLAHALGVIQPLQKWDSEDFDTVYEIKYDLGHFKRLIIKPNQYPVNFDGTWKEIYDKVE